MTKMASGISTYVALEASHSIISGGVSIQALAVRLTDERDQAH